MELRETPQGVTLIIFVKPNFRQFQVKIEDDEIVVCCREAPVKGRVNRELTKGTCKAFQKKSGDSLRVSFATEESSDR